jgi:signal transduction histidine kinase
MGFASLSLRSKLIFAFLLVTLLPLGVQGYWNYHALRHTLNDKADKSLFAAASQAADRLDAFITTNLDAMRTEAQLPTLIEYLSLPGNQRNGSIQEKRAAATLHALSCKDELFITSYALLDPQGMNLMDTHPSNVGLTESDRDYFLNPKETGCPYVSWVESSSLSEEANLYFSHPIYSKTNELIGVLRAQFSAAVLQLLTSATQGMAGEQSFAVLLDEYHIRLAHSIAPELNFKSIVPLDPQVVARLQTARRFPVKPVEELSTDLPAFERGLTNAGTDKPYFATQLTASGDQLHSAAVVRTKSRPWFVVFMQPQDVFLEPIKTQTRDMLILAIIIVAIAVIAAVSFAQFLSDPVTRLTTIASQIASGKLDQDIDTSRTDELGQLAKSFSYMQDSIRDKIAELNDEIDKRKQAEEALQKAHDELEIQVRNRTAELQAINKELEAFSYSVSHDLRGPLRAIDGFSRILLEDYPDALDEQGKHYLERVRAGSENMGQLIDDLLSLSRIGRRTITKKTINLETIAEDAYKSLRDESKDRKVNFIVQQCPQVLVDPNLMQIVFVNLFSNALKFTRCRETAEIKVGFETREKQTVFFVKDNGVGFDMKYADKLFIPFQRLHHKEDYEGTGVGLSIVQRIIHRHGGRIWVESEMGSGTTFYFTVPA